MKYGKWVVAGMFALLLGLEVIQETSRRTPAALEGQGGGSECLCATLDATATGQMVISPTPSATSTDGSTATPSASPTSLPMATPTIVPPGMTHTPDPLDCPGYPIAAPRKGLDYVYLDRNQTGWQQRIRACPSTDCRVVGYLARNVRRQTYYTFNGWESLNSLCSMWVFNPLGTLLER